MDRRRFSRSLLGFPLIGTVAAQAASRSLPETSESIRTINIAGKEETPFLKRGEAELGSYAGKGFLNHMWFGGDYPDYRRTRLRIYVDGEVAPSIDLELGLGVGVGFDDPAAPWGTRWGGVTGAPSGVFLNHRIPFSRSIRITAEAPKSAPADVPFWWIIRGLKNQALEVPGLPLGAHARLSLYKVENLRVEPFQFFDLFKSNRAGAVFQVTIAAKSTNLQFLEAQMRAYIDNSTEPDYLSSGLEDYFLGTYYFNRGIYHLPQAGLTHKDEVQGEFSAYRYHDLDPLVFSRGMRLVCRCGEMRGQKRFGNPQPTTYTTYAWVYEW